MRNHLKKIGFTLLLFCFWAFSLKGEEQKLVESISIFGNRRANTAMIQRVIPLKKGSAFSREKLALCKQTLEDLDIFRMVDLETRETEKGVAVIINVKEKARFYLSPSIRLNSDNNDFKFDGEEAEKSAYGIELGIKDFSGRRQRLKLSVATGKLHKAGIDYRKTYPSGLCWGISGENLWYNSNGYQGRLEKFKSRLFLGRRFWRFFIKLWAGYDHLKSKAADLLLEKDIKNRYRYGLDLTYDSRKPELFPLRGIRINGGFFQVLGRKSKKLYDRYTMRLAAFFNIIKQNVLALDLGAVFSDGYVPPDERVYLGGYRTLRTIPVGRYWSKQAMVLSCEYRVPLTRFPEPRGRSQFFSSSVYLFSDFAMLSETVNGLDTAPIKYNTGIGTILILNKESMLRLDVSLFPEFRLTLGSGWKF